MKHLLLAAILPVLVSCNTSIGLWRDTVHAFDWSKSKFRQMNEPMPAGQPSMGAPPAMDSQPDMEYGAPVY